MAPNSFLLISIANDTNYSLHDDKSDFPVAAAVDIIQQAQSGEDLSHPSECVINAPAKAGGIPSVYLLRIPTKMTECPCCKEKDVMTRVSTYPTVLTMILCIIILVLFWPLCWVPLAFAKVNIFTFFSFVMINVGKFHHRLIHAHSTLFLATILILLGQAE
jgi:hypothetical protein